MTQGKAETKGVKKKTDESQYMQAVEILKGELELLKKLNKQLSKSIKEEREKREDAVTEKMRKMDEKSKAEFFKSLQPMFKIFEESKGEMLGERRRISLTMKENHAKLFVDAIDAVIIPDRFNVFIREMSLIYLITQFESFLGKMLEISFSKKPEILISSKKSMTFEELLRFENIEGIKQQILEKETSSIINQDIEDINRCFRQNFDLDFSQFVNWRTFKERFYRRNILIHNSGKTNRIYRLKTGYKGKDKRMTVSRSYLTSSIKLFDKVASEISKHFESRF